MTGPRDITLVGRDAPLWLAAAALRRALAPAGVAVRVVELPAETGAADLYPTLPAIEALHNQIGINEAALLRTTRGAFTLGQNFVDASDAGRPSFLHGYGAHGTAIDGGDFFPHWVKARHHGLDVGLDDFSLTASAARGGRLFFPDADSEIYGRSDYGYHLPAAAYAKSLKAIARHLGVELFETATVAVERGDAGVAALLLDDGRRIESALFADLTRERLLSGGAFEAWDTPGDRVLSALAPRPAALPAYAEIRAGAGGWTGLFPGLTHIHVQHVFSRAATTDQEARAAAEAACGLPLDAVTVRPFAAGVAAEPWAGNVIALGDAACVLDPAHGFALHGLQLGIVHLLAAYPADGAGYAARRVEYNRVLRSHLARVADFQAAHHVLQNYSGAFWDAARALPLSEELGHRIDLFAARGELAPLEDESLPPDSWRALFVGHGIMPESWRPAADRVPPDEVKAHFRKMLGFVREAVLRQPTHDACLARIMQSAHG
ncbi:Tryptophan halogenase [uncultured Sphingopyxis sp.]|uniref:Tryptophan halogenase n=1 Tax=uncultured Sphingopyxis sp. TaxID=310581 RepID=A0A1Y5Q3F5_9SPHN|nr:tryptophan 7-halogenase [uncultured Sphingopyxis sp.]SBV34004.1 Tryptophan halogenase [uncultured Sphingopyxis sp.]